MADCLNWGNVYLGFHYQQVANGHFFFFFKKKSFSLFLFAENLYYAKFPEFTDVLFMVEKQPFSHMIILS